MNRLTWVVGGLILIAAILGAYIVIQQSQQPSPPPSSGTGNAAVGANGASSVITYTDKGFSPTPLSVAQGTTVTWANQSSHSMWIEGAAPTGGNCGGSGAHEIFNECKSVGADGSYSYTFRRTGTFPYSNHSQSNDRGVITVTEASVSGPINPHAIPE